MGCLLLILLKSYNNCSKNHILCIRNILILERKLKEY